MPAGRARLISSHVMPYDLMNGLYVDKRLQDPVDRRNAHIRLCATMLSALRSELLKERISVSKLPEGCERMTRAWHWLCGQDRHFLSQFAIQTRSSVKSFYKEIEPAFELGGHRQLARQLIRWASEGLKWHLSVDIVTTRVGRHFDEHPDNELTLRPKTGTLHTHEHMYPVAAALRDVVAAGREGCDLNKFLRESSFRAFVTRTENSLLLKDKLPDSASSLPVAFRAFERYRVAGLLDELQPVSQRGRRALERFLARKKLLGVVP